MSDEVDIRALTVTAAAKLLNVSAKIINAHVRRGLPLVNGKVDLIVYGAWLNQESENQTPDLSRRSSEGTEPDGA